MLLATSALAVVVANREQLIMRFPRGALVAEIGVDEGVFSRSILCTNPSRLYLIDPWEKQTGDYAGDPTNDGNFERKYTTVRDTLGLLPNVEIIRDYSLKAVERFPDGYFDWIYLDANHSYRGHERPGGMDQENPAGGHLCGPRLLRQPMDSGQAGPGRLFRASGRRLDYLTTDDVFLSWGFIV